MLRAPPWTRLSPELAQVVDNSGATTPLYNDTTLVPFYTGFYDNFLPNALAVLNATKPVRSLAC